MNEETFESNLPGVYLAGVVQAGMNTSKLFIENTRHHGEVIVREVFRSTVAPKG
jgi:thioredoxin reductase (NADPH)